MNRSLSYFRKYFHIPKNRLYCSKVEACEHGPVKFTTSAAAKKRTVPILRKPDSNMPWYQPYSIVSSISVFLIYFCILREENDMDLEFDKTLYERIKGLEKEQLLQSYKFNKENGMSVEHIENRLKELEEQEAKAVS